MRFGNMDALIRADRMRAQTRVAIRWGLWGMIPDILDDARRLIPAEPRAVDRWRSLAHIAGDARAGRIHACQRHYAFHLETTIDAILHDPEHMAATNDEQRRVAVLRHVIAFGRE